jgi:hypothetical protein
VLLPRAAPHHLAAASNTQALGHGLCAWKEGIGGRVVSCCSS